MDFELLGIGIGAAFELSHFTLIHLILIITAMAAIVQVCPPFCLHFLMMYCMLNILGYIVVH